MIALFFTDRVGLHRLVVVHDLPRRTGRATVAGCPGSRAHPPRSSPRS